MKQQRPEEDAHHFQERKEWKLLSIANSIPDETIPRELRGNKKIPTWRKTERFCHLARFTLKEWLKDILQKK